MLGNYIRPMSVVRVGALLLASLAAAPLVAQAQAVPFIGPSGALQPSPSEPPGAQLFGTYFDADDGRAIVALSAGPSAGRVFTYKRGPNGEWLDDGAIVNPTPSQYDGFGTGVAVEGRHALVRTSDGGYQLYKRIDSGWVSLQHIESTPGLDFNNQVDFENGIAAIGAPNSPGGGSVVIYRLQNDELVKVKVLHASDATEGDGFGVRLDLSPTALTLVVGAGSAATNWSGSAYVFQHLGPVWLPPEKLETGIPSSLFGDGVATSDLRLVIGASAENSGHGAVYVYRRGLRKAWVLQQRLDPPQTAYDTYAFGNDIAIGAGHVVIGAHFSSPGLAFGYRECKTGLCPEFATQAASFFAEYVAIEGREAFISSPYYGLVYRYPLQN